MNLGIVGNGFVGNALYEGMRTHFDCYIYDIDEKRSHSSLQEVAQCDFIFLCVPTPMQSSGSIDMSYINNSVENLKQNGLKKTSIIVIKSTVTPGTCATLQKTLKNYVLSNPEFLTERYALEDFLNPRCIIIGGDNDPRDKLYKMYNKRFSNRKYFLTDSTTSELIKYTTNCFFGLKVTFMNEMKEICDAAGGNWEDLVDGFIAEGRVHPEHLDVPGHDGKLGFGGKCFPKDMNALVSYAIKEGLDPELLSSAIKKNNKIRK